MKLLESDQPILFLIGPSATGKSSVLIKLSNRKIIELTPSWTTRQPRRGEDHTTIEHKFISSQEFSELADSQYFLEVFDLFGLPYKFGLPAIKTPQNNALPAIVLRTYLLPKMSKHYPNAVVYALEDEFDKVEARLNHRFKQGEPIGSRLQEYQTEIKLGRKLAKRTFKNDSTIENLAEKIEEAMKIDF